MSRKTVEHTATFSAHSPDGKRYTIHVFTEYLESKTRDGTGRIEGLKSMRTSDGDAVNYISKGHYQKIGFREVDLVSDDPEAP